MNSILYIPKSKGEIRLDLMKIEDILDGYGMNHSALARRMGCSPANVFKMLSFGRVVTLNTAQKLARALSVRTAEIIEEVS